MSASCLCRRQPAARTRFGTHTLLLERALAMARQYAPALQRAEAEAGVAVGDLRATGQWPNPVLEYRREKLGAPLDPDEFFTAYVPIDVTGRRLQLRRATTSGVGRVAAERETAIRALEWELARAWYGAVLAEAVALRTRVEAMRLAHELALSSGAGAEVQRPLASVVLGGLITSTVLTLLVLPVLYRALEARTERRIAQRAV